MRLALLAAVALCASCAATMMYPTPYQSYTRDEGAIPGGYIDRDLGQGDHLVTFRGNPATMYEDVVAFAHRRAGELCPGGYSTLSEEDISEQAEGSDRAVATRIGGAVIVNRRHRAGVTYPRVRMQIRCNPPQ